MGLRDPCKAYASSRALGQVQNYAGIHGDGEGFVFSEDISANTPKQLPARD